MNLREKYQLTEGGEKGLKKSIISSVFMFISMMLPVILVFEFADNLLNDKLKPLTFYILLMIAVIFIMIIILSFNYNATYGTTYKESKNLRIKLVEKFQKIPLSYFDKFDLSDLAQTIMKDIVTIEHAMSHAIPDFYGNILLIFVLGIMAIICNPILGSIITGFNLLSIAFVLLSKKFFIKGWSRDYKELREITNSIQNLIELNSEIRSYNMEEDILNEVDNLIDENEKYHFILESKIGSYCTLGTAILNVSIGATILASTYLYLNGKIDILYSIGFIMMAIKLSQATSLMFLNIEEIIFLNPTIDRIREINNQKEFIGEDIKLSNCNTEFRNVEFSYSNDTMVIDDLSFKSMENSVTALVGSSGCGKTTVIKLLSRLYEYNKGLIAIGNVDIGKVFSDNLYEKVTIVFQNVVLFNGTIMDNIRLGKHDASDEEVIEASKAANCHEFIMKLRNGYNTIIGENGSMLSGGERQRISIARAFLKNAPIIILDEISASLDVENEMKIQESLNRLIKNKTVFIISHRMKSIENVSNILVMDKGKRVGFGNHKDLLNTCELYRNMVEKSKLSNEYIY